MAKNLKKGQRINLSLEIDVLDSIAIGLSWDDSHFSEKVRDVDISAFMIAQDGKVPLAEYFVFYNNPRSADRSLLHKGDNRTGQGEGDDETLWLNFEQIDRQITEIILVASIYGSKQSIDSFGEVQQVNLRVYNRKPLIEIASYVVNTAQSTANAFVIGRFYREFGTWFFEASEEVSTQGLASFVDRYA